MPELAIIFGSILIMAVLALIIGSEIHKRDIAYKQRKLELQAEAAHGQRSPDAAKVEQLEQRVRVLERLATDRGQDLALQIENLRDSAPTGMMTDFSATREESRT